MRRLILMALMAATAAPVAAADDRSGEAERRYQDQMREQRETDRQRFEGERRRWEQRRREHERQREAMQGAGRWSEAARLRWEAQREQIEADRQAMEDRRNRREEAWNRAQDARNRADAAPRHVRHTPPAPLPALRPPAFVAPSAYPESYTAIPNKAEGFTRPARRLGPEDPLYRGPSGRYYCRRADGSTGVAIIGRTAGPLLGRAITPGQSKTLGALASNPALRRAIERGGIGCR